jgi:hypothetical protein
MNRHLKLIIAGNLIVLAVLAFVFPHLMVGPGKLIPGHQKLERTASPAMRPSPAPPRRAASAATSRPTWAA